jgi:uncharacterized protein YdaU (DUF1376 family)
MKRGKADAVSVDAWRPQWIGDELAETARLSTEQFGAYQLLLMAYWRNRGPLPDDDEELATITRLGRAGWKKQRAKIALLFVVENGVWRHLNLDAEWAQSMALAQKRKAKAIKAADARWGQAELPLDDAPSNAPSNAPSTPGALLEECPSPSPSPSPVAPSEHGSAREPEDAHYSRADLESGVTAQQMPLDDRSATAIAIVKGLRRLGCPRAANVHDPRLLAVIDAGVTAAFAVGVAEDLIEASPTKEPPQFAYVLATARGRLKDAAQEPTHHGHPSRPAASGESAADAVLRSIRANRSGTAGRPDGD